MRSRELISQLSPCDADYTDRSLQTVADAKIKSRRYCTNLTQCQERSRTEGISCTLRFAQQMAGFILGHRSPFEEAVQKERTALLKEKDQLEGEYWVYRDGKWLVVQGIESAVDDIVNFALTIIDRQAGERRPFTKDGMRVPELGPTDALHNAMLDLDDVYGEIGQRNPLR